MKQVLVLALLAVALAPSAARAQEPPRKPSQSESAAAQYFGDTALIDQDGRARRFYTDVLKDTAIVIHTFCSTCTSTTAQLISSMQKLQDAMSARLGKGVLLVSITVDPAVDTPARLKAFAARAHARPGWLFLTGSNENVETVLRKLGQWVEAKETHSTILLIGNVPTGLWKKADGLAAAGELIKIVESVVQDKGGLVQRPIQ